MRLLIVSHNGLGAGEAYLAQQPNWQVYDLGNHPWCLAAESLPFGVSGIRAKLDRSAATDRVRWHQKLSWHRKLS